MNHIRKYKKLCIILVLICILIQAGLAMPFLSQVWVLNSLSRGVEPSIIASLYECEHFCSEDLRQFSYSNEGLLKLFSYIKLNPSKSFSTAIYYRSHESLWDHRDNIKYLMMSHFHGSRYKDINPQSRFL